MSGSTPVVAASATAAKKRSGVLDRLLHRSVVFNIDGDSYRMRAHQARATQLRKGVAVPSNR